MRKQSSPLGDRLTCPSPSSGAVPTKNICCLPINSSISAVISSCTLAITVPLAWRGFPRLRGPTCLRCHLPDHQLIPAPAYCRQEVGVGRVGFDLLAQPADQLLDARVVDFV